MTTLGWDTLMLQRWNEGNQMGNSFCEQGGQQAGAASGRAGRA